MMENLNLVRLLVDYPDSDEEDQVRSAFLVALDPSDEKDKVDWNIMLEEEEVTIDIDDKEAFVPSWDEGYIARILDVCNKDVVHSDEAIIFDHSRVDTNVRNLPIIVSMYHAKFKI